MPFITISDATMRALEGEAIFPFRSDATRLDDGRWRVPLDSEVTARIRQFRAEGETDDDVVVRLIAFAKGRRN